MSSHPLLRPHYLGAYTVFPEGADGEGRYNWGVVANLRDPEEGRTVEFSASLVFALADEAFNDPWERPIPPSVINRLESLARRLEKAGLF